MNSSIKYIILAIFAIIFSGCGQPSIPKVTEIEVNKYEQSYLTEYEDIKKTFENIPESFQMVQPNNKRESCKVYVSINPKNDKTIKSDYSLYWDGQCKNGFAVGLGREIETTMLSNIQQIGFYEKGKAIDYCVAFDPLEGKSIEGECSYSMDKSNHNVTTIINDKNGDLNIVYLIGRSMSKNSPQIMMKTFPFLDVVEYYKIYPNFAYTIYDLTKNEFDNRKYEFNILKTKNKKNHGYGFALMKKGFTNAGEMVNGNLKRRVLLPQSYFNNANNILSEIKSEANVALEAQRRALIIKEKYKKKICRNNVKVTFMDNNDYKSICNENERFAKLKERIDMKLSKIEQQKAVKRGQENQQRLIQAREAEARAAQRRASAAEQANNQASWDSLNRSIQNMNNNNQMQQLNNNMMMYNMMPKKHNVYIH